MGDWCPQVVSIEKVEAHTDSDNLDIVVVLGDYPVVVKRGSYQVGDVAGYLHIDTIVPDTEQFAFLSPRHFEQYEEDGVIKQRALGPKYMTGSIPEKYRIIKAKRLRGRYSQGMMVEAPSGMQIGESLVEVLGLKKWEEAEEDNLPTLKQRGTNAESPPSGWTIPYYDIESVRKYLSCFREDEEVVLQEKLNGCNFSACHDGEKLWVKSRNYYKKRDEQDIWWNAAIRYELESRLANHPKLVFFGELVGNVKHFRYDAELVNGQLHTKVHFFDVYDTTSKRYFNYDDRIKLITEIGLTNAPELYRGVWRGKEEMYPYAEGQSTLNVKTIREGWVMTPVVERYEERLDSRWKVKCVGEGYNLNK